MHFESDHGLVGCAGGGVNRRGHIGDYTGGARDGRPRRARSMRWAA